MGVETTPTCMGSVDFFHYENGTLNAIGWAFDPTFASMGQPRIAFYQGTQKLQEASCTTIYRTMWLMPLEIRMRKVPDFLSWQRFLRRQRLLFSWNTEPQRIPEDSLSERSREPGIRKSFWYTRSKIRRVSEISVISNSVIYAVREKGISTGSLSAEGGCDRAVYNGLEYFDALFSGIEKTKVPYRLILVNDKSPDSEVGNYLEKYAAEHDNVVLLNNETNMGFLPSVNRGLKMAENHVALVNTDVEVPEEWLER